jgi:hypothetical protein
LFDISAHGRELRPRYQIARRKNQGIRGGKAAFSMRNRPVSG